MGDILAFPAMHQPVPCCEYALFNIIKGIVKLGFQKSVSMAEDVLLADQLGP